MFASKVKAIIESFTRKPKSMNFSEQKTIKVSMVEIINGKAYKVIPCGKHGAILERL